jgi:DNA-directed RNA polymerase specialized sigma24 family protein
MQAKPDVQLLREYADCGIESAFHEIVIRYTNLVFSAAARQTDSSDSAAEMTQRVFIGLAQGAKGLLPRLREEATLAGWLCRRARNGVMTKFNNLLHDLHLIFIQPCHSGRP